MAAQLPPTSRLDKALVARGLARSRDEALELIDGMSVRVNGAIADKASRVIKRGDSLLVMEATPRFVGRGARKLVGALDELNIATQGVNFCDLGSSTGGFTQVLLERGANLVVAVDVGRGQMSERVAKDPRVILLEGLNARKLTRAEYQLPAIDNVVGDLSFISLEKFTSVIVTEILQGSGSFLLLVKPQFELDRQTVSRGRGVVREPSDWARAITRVSQSYLEAGAQIVAVVPSPLRGSSGNQEFFIHGHVGIASVSPGSNDLESLVSQAVSRAQPREEDNSP